jgi:hypothetical protein
MAITKTIEIVTKVGDAAKDIKKLFDNLIEKEKEATEGVEELNEGLKDLGTTSEKSLKNIEKSVDSTKNSTKSLAEGFKGAGLALKAIGIGLIISALSTLKEIFMGNQKVADTFSAVLGTVSNVFTQVTNVIVGVIEKVNETSGGFKGLSAVIGGLLKLALTPLKLAFFGIKLVIDEVRLAWEESIFGDGDSQTIKDLTKRIQETQASLKKVGDEAIEAGKQVVDNIGDAINEIGQVVEGTIDGVSKISIAAAYEQSKANVQLQNNAKLAEATQARLVEQYDRQAEKLRQIRDEERNSVADRIKANNDLEVVLNKQEKAMIAQANAQIAAAQSTLAQNNNIENQAALINALANKEGVLAQIEGLRSEQKANDLALSKELLELTKSRQEAETELAINQKLFDAERIRDEEAKLIAQKEALENSKVLELERLQNVIDNANAGTQAKIDAENEYALKKQEIENAIIAKEDELEIFKFEKELEKKAIQAENEALDFETRLALLNERDAIILANESLTEEERTKLLKENSDARISIAQKEAAAKLAMLNAVSAGLSLASQELGESTAAGKLAAVAAASISTYTAIAGQLAAFSGVPIPGYAIAQAIITGATGLLQVKKILSVKTPKGTKSSGAGSAPSVGGAGGGQGATPQNPTPQFNVLGNSGINQIAQTLGQQQPVQAFVVANNVTTAQSLDRNIISNASLG